MAQHNRLTLGQARNRVACNIAPYMTTGSSAWCYSVNKRGNLNGYLYGILRYTDYPVTLEVMLYRNWEITNRLSSVDYK